MQNIKVTRYPDPKALGFAGYFEPEDRSWIGFIDLDGRPRLHLHRDPETGAVLPDDPAARASALEIIRAEQARRAAWVEPIPGVYYPVLAGETFCGRTQPPAPLPIAGVKALADCPAEGLLVEQLVS